MQRLEIRLLPCDSSRLVGVEQTCAGDVELDDWLESHELVFSMMTNYIDYDDIEQPVHGVIENRFLPLDLYIWAQMTYNLHVHYLAKMDNWV